MKIKYQHQDLEIILHPILNTVKIKKLSISTIITDIFRNICLIKIDHTNQPYKHDLLYELKDVEYFYLML